MTDDPDDEQPTPLPEHRRPSAAERRLYRRTHPHGVDVVRMPDEQLSIDEEIPFDWTTEPSRPDAEGLRRASRDPDQPVAPAELSAIIRQVARRLRREMQEVLAQAPADLVAKVEQRIATLEKDFAPVRQIGRWAAGAALAALVAVVGFVYHRGQDEQHVTDELTRLGGLVDKLENKIAQLQTGPRQ